MARTCLVSDGALALAMLLLLPTLAFAQFNDVFLGQIGDTNTIAIDQTGAGNRVGGEKEGLRLSQLGDRNVIAIQQVGQNNGVGGEDFVGETIFLTGQVGSASGLYQIGSGNRLDVEQRTARTGGGNGLGAIRQDGESETLGQINEIVVSQIGGAFDPSAGGIGVSSGPGLHRIHEITQTYGADPGANAANRVVAVQEGLQQSVGQFHQSGAANIASLRQSGEANSLRMASQDGVAHRTDLRQDGVLNTLGNVVQFGAAHAATVRIDGSGNLLDQIVQAGLGGSEGTGNTVLVSILGDDNGGEGIGGYRAVSAQGGTPAAFAASLEQYGDRNAATLTTGSGEGRADDNGFSALQAGSDNQASAAATGDANLLSLLQSGDGNSIDLFQASVAGRGPGGQADGNQARLQQSGALNRMEALQTGRANRLDVQMSGERNVAVGGRLGPGLPQLAAGLIQTGRDQTAVLDMAGSRNAVALRQIGAGHRALGFIRGNANMAAILQSGTGHVAVSRQFGDRNYALVQQD